MFLTPNRWVGGRNLHMFFLRTDLKARYSYNILFSSWFFFLSSNSITSEATTERENKHNTDQEIMTPRQREIIILQVINLSNANDNNENPRGDNQRHIRHLINQSRATNNNYKNTPRPIHETQLSKDRNQETNTNTSRAINIAQSKELFTKSREQIPKPQEQPSPQMNNKIQPIIMRINGNEAVGNTVDQTQQENNFRIYFQNVNGLAVGKGTRKWEDMIQEMTTRQVSVCGFAETNTKWHAKKAKARLKANLRKVAGQAT
jgi:hypothetical protein